MISALAKEAESCHGLFGAVRRIKINNEIEALEEEPDSLKEAQGVNQDVRNERFRN